tara:strand:+ start:20823 stop:21137 length:315 start_codon:yes stop_codon:yes gene_type:complete
MSNQANEEIVKKYFKKYFKSQYLQTFDHEYKSLVRILNKKDKEKQAYHESRVNAVTDEMISNHIENYIEKYGYKMHDLSSENECLTLGGVENCVELIKNKLLNK